MENQEKFEIDWGTSPKYLDYLILGALAICGALWAFILITGRF